MEDTGSSSGERDAGVPQVEDLGSLPDLGHPVDAGGDRPFCEGTGKMQFGDAPPVRAAVTSSPTPLMDCCNTVSLRFHPREPGWPWLEVTLDTGYAFAEPEQVVDLENHLLFLWQDGQPLLGDFLSVSGTMEYRRQPDGSARLGLCATLQVPWNPAVQFRLHSGTVPLFGWDELRSFEVRLLLYPELTAVEAARYRLADLPLASVPLLDLLSLAAYDPATFTFHLDFWSSYPEPPLESVGVELESVGVEGMPFVVLARGERLYLGAFWSSFSSYSFEGPTVRVEEAGERSWLLSPGTGQPDPRNDPRLLEVLRRAGKLVEP